MNYGMRTEWSYQGVVGETELFQRAEAAKTLWESFNLVPSQVQLPQMRQHANRLRNVRYLVLIPVRKNDAVNCGTSGCFGDCWRGGNT